MATPNIVPRADSEGGLGTASKYWASAYVDTITTTSHINLPDSAELRLGTGNDFRLYHNGNDSYVNNGTGSLYIRITSQLVQPAFLNSVMSCSSMKTWLEEQSLGATMPNLNKKILHSIQVPIPTTAVQKNYALALDVLCKQRQEQKEHIKELDGLFNALMQKAFKGELNL